MRLLLAFSIFIASALVTTTYAKPYTISVNRADSSESYTADIESGILMIERRGETITKLPDIVGHTGQITKTLTSFNNGPALSYENSGSNTYFEIFYTLTLKKGTPFIDCAYANIRNGQNGVSVRKAVCNLEAPLSNNYQDLIFSYSDAWIDASNEVSLQSIMNEPSKAALVLLGPLGEVNLSLRYESIEDLMSASPRTIATKGGKLLEVTAGNAYLVYDADGITPLALDVEMDPISHTLKRLTSTELSRAIDAN
ncbi:hypothetical protein [Stutzerimonas stutzeri]|uniref:hypothetical protein n=1 Tax=Stutzerimonas stutzeri TaxID=316 RepID=UPI0021FB7FB6|nr:hypothetical protein [Stutzerimonas stutzeri]UVO18259.1 hypothetical protein KN217_00675 [Stutzerimonas stutzeri]